MPDSFERLKQSLEADRPWSSNVLLVGALLLIVGCLAWAGETRPALWRLVVAGR